ncbi:MAG: restriction endonuclease, partial [Phascolarctobacterium sp.]
NHYIQAKIRQQLQLLRDKGLLEFCGNGSYKKNF